MYIKQNLKTEINAEELAEIAGYSPWHFGRLFTQATGRSIAAYICKCRLDAALQEMVGGRKAIDIAYEYGFDTYAGFYKAFMRMYGISPKKYLSLYLKREAKMLSQHELREALAHWDVPQGLELRNIYNEDGAKGIKNVWRYGEAYILKTDERDHVLRDLALHSTLAAQGFASAAALPTKTGSKYLDGERVFILVHELQGTPLPKTDRFGESRYEFGQKYGKALAKLHLALKDIEADIMPNEKNQYKEVVEWAMPKIELPEGFVEDYIKNFGAIFPSLPKQLIHRDPNPSNILFANGEITGFIGFDISEHNMRLWDVCYCATGILSGWKEDDEQIKEKWLLILQGIIHGYDSITPLTIEEKQSIYYVIMSIQLIFIAYLESHLGRQGFAEMAQANREMLDYIIGIKAQIEEIF